MLILYSPQRNDNARLSYSFDGEVITATYKRIDAAGNVLESMTDTFDFSSLPDGVAVGVETVLPVNPIISARREDGVLKVELLNFIGPDATEEERFPTWKEV